jgi:DNA (cytosine-5)-methyltransferase 1
MFSNGAALRCYRERVGLSQARIAEATGIPQHLLSAFELGKSALDTKAQQKLSDTFASEEALQGLSHRRKRYRQHAYSARCRDPERVAKCQRTVENAAYLAELDTLSRPAPPSFTGMSLFSGAGGFSLGFRAAGCKIKAHVEIDDGLSSIYRANFLDSKRLGGCIRNVTNGEIAKFLDRSGPIDVLLGGPPCQGFSLAGKRNAADTRNELFRDYLRILDIVRPKIAILENVRLLTSMKTLAGMLVKDEIRKGFKEKGYNVEMYELNASDFGVPQHRDRVIFLAVDRALPRRPSMPEPTHGPAPDLLATRRACRTFADGCSDLAYLESSEATSGDDLHRAVSHPDHVIEWLWEVPQGQSAHNNADPALRPLSGYNTTYKRQIWDEPGATVQTTFGMISGCRNVHPIATRSLTAREAARLQSFPDDYRFVGSLGTIRTGIGNAVPPLLAKQLAAHIRSNIL